MYNSYTSLCEKVFLVQNEKEIKHTIAKGDTLIFTPSLIIGLCPDAVISEALHITRCMWKVQQLYIEVDCSSLTTDGAHTLWSASSWENIRRGFKVFSTLPNQIKEIRILSPVNEIKYWNIILNTGKLMITPKMRSRLHIISSTECIVESQPP